MKPQPFEALLARVVRRRMRSEAPEQLQQVLQTWLQRSPQSAAAHALAGLIEGLAGDVPNGRRKLQLAATAPGACTLWAMAQWHLLGAEGAGDLAAARTCLEQALAIDPTDADCWCALAQLEGAESRWLPAAQAASRACELDAHTALPWLIRAELALQSQDLALAQAACAEALARDPGSAAGYELQARVLAQAGQLARACEQLELAMMLQPPAPRLLIQLAQWGLLGGDPSQRQPALARARQAAALAPNEWRAVLLEGQALQAQRRHAEAAARLGAAVQAHPQVVELRAALVCSALVLGKPELAEQTMEQGLAAGADASAIASLRLDTDLRLARWPAAFAAMQEGQPELAQGESVHRFEAAALLDLLTFTRWCAPLAATGVRVEVLVPPQDASFVERVPGVSAVRSDMPLAPWPTLDTLPGRLGLLSPAQSLSGPWLHSAPAAQQAWRQHLQHLPRPWLFVDVGEAADADLIDLLGAELARRQGSLLLGRPMPAWEEGGHAVRIQHVQPESLDDAAACLTVADERWLLDGELAALTSGLGLEARVYVRLMHHPYWAGQGPLCAWYPGVTAVRETLDGWPARSAATGLAAPTA
ncbi:MAG TPA: hypothetical protein VMK82_02670 [Steroidobacteraceae bacterium]|nr:hypothetical protein [Steroidobacteraceae bacterium]